MARPSYERSLTPSPKSGFTSSPKLNLKASPKQNSSPSPRSTTEPENPWDRFYLMENQHARDHTVWDPWPVKRFGADHLFKTAQKLVKQRNEANVDNLINRVILLPASGGIPGIHGGWDTDLYSLRSPSQRPVRVHLWMTAQGKILVRNCGSVTTFINFLKSFDLNHWGGAFKYYNFWKSTSLSHMDMIQLGIPDRLHHVVHERWWSINVFRFLDLPAELRNMIISFAMSNTAEPYSHVYRPKNARSRRIPALDQPNVNLFLVNKQLRREAIPILLKQVTFTFHQHGQLLRFFEQISREDRLAIQSLELVFNQETLLDFFGAQVFRRHNSSQGDSSAFFYFINTLFTDRIRLKHLRIYFPHTREKKKCKKLRYSCQRTVNLWIWAAARGCLRDIPKVEFTGYVDEDQKKEWLDTLALERKGFLSDPKELELWQREVWDTE